MERTMLQRLLAEFIGTFTLIFVGVASIMAVDQMQQTAGTAVGAGLVTIALAHGLAIGTMVSSLGHVSGAHFNPAVTIAMWATQKIKLVEGLGYILAQIAGATAAAGLLRVAVPEAIWKLSNLGVPTVGTRLTNGQAVLIEAVLTFLLVWVIFATAVDPEGSFGKIAGLAIGFVIVMDIMAGGPFTGAAMNPARALGPMIAGGTWANWWVWWMGPIAGGIVAASLYDSVILTPRGRGGSAAEGEEAHGWGAHGEDADSTRGATEGGEFGAHGHDH